MRISFGGGLPGDEVDELIQNITPEVNLLAERVFFKYLSELHKFMITNQSADVFYMRAIEDHCVDDNISRQIFRQLLLEKKWPKWDYVWRLRRGILSFLLEYERDALAEIFCGKRKVYNSLYRKMTDPWEAAW